MRTRSRRRFTPEFKAEAVRLVEASGGNIAPVAKELGVYDSTLWNWVRDARCPRPKVPVGGDRDREQNRLGPRGQERNNDSSRALTIGRTAPRTARP
jgi:transposase-like protein